MQIASHLICYVYLISQILFLNEMKSAPSLRPLVAGLSPQRSGFLSRPLYWCVGFMVQKANLNTSFLQVLRFSVGRHTSVGIVTRYGWAVRGSNPDGVARFSAPVLLFNWHQICPGNIAAEMWYCHLQRPKCDISHLHLVAACHGYEWVETYFCSPYTPMWRG